MNAADARHFLRTDGHVLLRANAVHWWPSPVYPASQGAAFARASDVMRVLCFNELVVRPPKTPLFFRAAIFSRN